MKKSSSQITKRSQFISSRSTLPAIEMKFSRCKSEHLADYLRSAIQQGLLSDPLPPLREWSASLDVSCGTLQSALRIMKHEGLVRSLPKKGYFLARRKSHAAPQHLRSVRWIRHSVFREVPVTDDSAVIASQKLNAKGIRFQIEYRDDSHIQAICKTGTNPSEILIFSSVNFAQQKLLQMLNNALIIGIPLPGIDLPYISSDVYPAIRHAIHHLLRHGHNRIELLNLSGRKVCESISRLEKEFRTIQEESPLPFEGGVTLIPNEYTEQCRVIQKLASRIRDRQGIVVNLPISPSLLLTILQSRGFKIPDQVEILPVNCMPSQLQVYPPLQHYPYPAKQIAGAICKAALHYFETGIVPRLQKLIPLEVTTIR